MQQHQQIQMKQFVILFILAIMLACSGDNDKEVNDAVVNLNDSVMVASWTNHVSETIPFFERFFLKRIE